MQDSKEQGSFVNGFGIGLLTGVAAYFLFGTDQGKQIRKQMLSEWDDVAADFTKDTKIEPPKKMKAIVVEALRYFAQSIYEAQMIHQDAEKNGKALPTRSRKADGKVVKPTSKFKGV